MTAPHLGILVGFAGEARLLSALGRPPAFTTTILASGAYPAGARMAASQLAESAATHLLSFGLAGGLDPSLRPGTVLLPSAVVTAEGVRFSVDTLWHSRAAALLASMAPDDGPILGADAVIASTAEKSRLHRAAACAVVDMESHLLAEAAASCRKKLLILRVVADPASASLPEAAQVAIRRDGGLDAIAILRSLGRRPGQISGLVRLARDSAVARRSLLRCVRLGGDTGFAMI